VAKLFLFLAFLLVYVLWQVACFFAFKVIQSSILKDSTLIVTEMNLLLGLIGFFLPVYLLSGLWSLKLFLLVLAASQLSVVLAWALNFMLGGQSSDSGRRAYCIGNELEIRHLALFKMVQVVFLLILIAYPIFAGIAFFRYPWSSSILQTIIVRYTLVALNLCGYAFICMVSCQVLASDNLDDETRQWSFINQAAGLAPTAIWVALASWSFGFAGAQLNLGPLGIPAQTLSWQTLVLLLAVFALAVLVPYVAGTARFRRKRISLLEKQKSFVGELEWILESPTASGYLDKLNALSQKLAAERTAFIQSETLLQLEQEIQAMPPEQVPLPAKSTYDALEKTRDLDPRFRYADALQKLGKDIEEIEAELKNLPPAAVVAAAKQFGDNYRSLKDELDKQIESTSVKKPFITAGAGSVVSAIVMAILGEVGKTAWQWIAVAHK
jgi:hypothetical protein